MPDFLPKGEDRIQDDEPAIRPCMFSGGADKMTIAEELDYFDRLGPATKATLEGWCVFRWSVIDILREFDRRGWHHLAKRHDEAMAEIVRQNERANQRPET